MLFCRTISLAIASLILATCLAPFAAAQPVRLRMATVDADSQPAIFMATFARIASNDVEGVEIDVFADRIDTLDTLSLSRGLLDMSMVSPVTHDLMAVAGELFEQETVAAELSKAVQLLLWFPRGQFYFAVRDDSDISTLEDISGARVYLGPHTQSSAYYDAKSWIAATTGLIAEQDYEVVTDTWDVGAEALLSGDVDVFISACLNPCRRLEALSHSTGVRFIGPSISDNAGIARFFQAGRSQANVRSELRDGIWSGDTVASFQSVAGIGVYDFTDEQIVYDITKAFWDDLDQMATDLPWDDKLDIAYAARTRGLIQFHPGAARYYKEVGAH